MNRSRQLTKKKYQTFIFDLDDTLLNFKSAEQQALQMLFADLKLELDVPAKKAFSTFNQSLWKKLEKKEITREQLFEERFHTFLKNYYQLEINGNNSSDQYLSYLAFGHEEIKGAKELLNTLFSEDKHLFLATNGVTRVQEKRLKDAQMANFFEQVFISEKIGTEKPDPGFFSYLFSHSNADPSQTVIVGDSLSSDVLGGINAGIDTVWFNPQRNTNFSQILPSYQIDSLSELVKFA